MAMELSPLQLEQLIFTKVFVEPTAGAEEFENLWAPSFDFTGVQVKVDVSVGSPEDEAEADSYIVIVRFAIPLAEEGGKNAPYTVEIEAKAWVSLAAGFVAPDRETVVRINGASLVLGSIRDLIQQLTARSVFGAMLIPTLRFLPDK